MKFRKKPVVIEAFCIPSADSEATLPMPSWLMSAIISGDCKPVACGGVDIATLEGTMRGNVGDWIIRGLKGELYPCKADIFSATYEQVDA